LNGTPRTLGYRWPAEWEPHAATWLSWPRKEESWPGKFAPVPGIFARMVSALAVGERVEILVPGAEEEAHVRPLLAAHGARLDAVGFHHIPTDDAWIRDHGPIFLTRDARAAVASGGAREECAPLVVTDWGYNAWGGKYPPWDDDDRVPSRIASELGLPVFQPGMILEGGSIDGNGRGTLLTTESCLLNPNRNPGLDRAAIEERLREYLGVRQILWLGDGIAGDDTDGHVDDLARFVGPRTIVTVVEPDPVDDNHRPLQDNLARLLRMADPDGHRFEIIELPMPAARHHEGQRLPASYANFYVGNAAVLVPTFGDPNDERALAVLGGAFPGRRIVGIDAVDLVWGLGAFHCVTQQQPAVAP